MNWSNRFLGCRLVFAEVCGSVIDPWLDVNAASLLAHRSCWITGAVGMARASSPAVGLSGSSERRKQSFELAVSVAVTHAVMPKCRDL